MANSHFGDMQRNHKIVYLYVYRRSDASERRDALR